MVAYSFDRFNVLVVDDNGFMRMMLQTVLHALGVGNVITAGDGGEAIAFLKNVKEDPAAAGVSNIDMVFSNWEMSPVDGAMLLKWTRRHRDSPDRFMPFVMVSGYADRDKVQEARDLGTSEFLVKPFSVDSLCSRLMILIDRPRQFVLTPHYFGPDRRRREVEPESSERRLRGEGDAEIHYDNR